MFDPFKDFETRGYLRNYHNEKNSEVVKELEHTYFTVNIDEAITFLAKKEVITSNDFLEVHRILFSEMYPWAGQDRSVTAPESYITKADIYFSHPSDALKAVNEGLRIGQIKSRMIKSPGLVMGLFAYGHPFLDGNGRTMLLVHMELSYRSGFSIDWARTNKTDYLASLSEEIRNPECGVLDQYLLPFVGPAIEREQWSKDILSINGLDGLDERNQIDGYLSDSVVAEKYRQFEQHRGYTYSSTNEIETTENEVKKTRSKDLYLSL